MAAELLTATQVQSRLGVDRSTVYRMAADGRLPAVKVGRQWRFPRAQIDQAIARGIPDTAPLRAVTSAGSSAPLPADVAEHVTDLVARSLGVMMLVTDMQGRPVSPVANPSPWFRVHGDDPGVVAECVAEWRHLADELAFTPTFRLGRHGFRCARSFLRVGNELVGMVLVGGLGEPDVTDVDDGHYHLASGDERRVLEVLPQVAAALSRLATGDLDDDPRGATDLTPMTELDAPREPAPAARRH